VKSSPECFLYEEVTEKKAVKIAAKSTCRGLKIYIKNNYI